MKDKLKVLWRRVVEATSSCLMMMTKGKILAITIGHWITALKTGFLTGIMAVAVAVFGNQKMQDNKFVVAGITGFLTAIADFFIHPSHYSGPHTEAIVTGIGAGLLCLALSNIDI